MVEKISSEQAYVNYVMNKLPQVKQGKVYTMQKGDNLWKLAQRELNKKNAKNQEISEYMLLIAKLNNLDTIEKMNNLKVSDKIYLPQTTASAATTSSKPVAEVSSKKTQKQLNSAENSIIKLKDIVFNDKTINIEKMYKGYQSSTDLYHVYNEYTGLNGYYSHKHPVMSFVQDKNTGKIMSIYFNDQQSDKLPCSYDYIIDSKGNIVNNTLITKTPAGKMNTDELKLLHSKLNMLTQNSKISF